MTLVRRRKSIIDQDSLFENFDLLKKKNTSILSSPCGFFPYSFCFRGVKSIIEALQFGISTNMFYLANSFGYLTPDDMDSS